MTRYEKIKKALDNLTMAELVSVHNEYCDNANYYDDHIYFMEEFDEIMDGKTPWEIVRSAYYGDFCPAQDYFWFNGYGNLESSDFPTGQIDVDTMAEWIDENEEGLYCSEIDDILQEGKEDDE